MDRDNNVVEHKTKTSFSKRMESFMDKRIVPVLKVVSANKYLRSLMEGFYVTLPIIVFSSIIGIIMWVPPAIHGDMAWYPLAVRQFLNRLYVLSMGLVSIWFTMGIAVSLANKLNLNLPDTGKMNILMVAFAAGSAIFMMSVSGTFALNDDGTGTENFANILVANLGAQGMLTSILVGLTLPWVFYLPVKFRWTIKLPKAVPQGVSQSFADIIPYGLSIMVYWGFGYIFIYWLDMTFTDALFKAIQPIFTGLDSYGFLAAVALMTSFIWFIGVHGPSVTRPFLTPFMYSNLANNQQLLAQGEHPHWALTYEFSYDFSATLGGTGATFVIPILFILFCKSKKLKAVGIASYVPIWFQVNEPALFGAPLILNPIYMIPFFILPMINVVIYKFFIDVIGMNGAIADVPWSLPAVFGLLLGSGFDYLSILLWFIMITIDFFFYLPFVLIHDKMTCGEELKEAEEKNMSIPNHYNLFSLMYLGMQSKMDARKPVRVQAGERLAVLKAEIKDERKTKKEEKIEAKQMLKQQIVDAKESRRLAKLNKKEGKKVEAPIQEQKLVDKANYNILVICYGAGTSAMLAESIKKAARAEGIKNLVVDSAASGNHSTKIQNSDMVILSPQVKMYESDFRNEAPKHAVIVVTNGKEYIDATNSKEAALELIQKNAPKDALKK